MYFNGFYLSDPGLIFITYPAVISKFPLPQLWAVLFWIMMITVGLDTEVTSGLKSS